MKYSKDTKNNKLKKVIYCAVSLLLLFVIIFNIFILVKRFINKKNLENEIDELNSVIGIREPSDSDMGPVVPNTDYWNYLKMALENVNIDDLQKINGDTVGFLSISGTKINYPVVQASDNEFYLKHSFKKSNNGCGWLFMDYRNNPDLSSRNTVIYGHSNLDKTMFGSLSNVLGAEWAKNAQNGRITFINSDGFSSWKIISVYTIPAETYYIKTNFSSDASFENWADTIVKRSIRNFDYKYSENDHIMTFSTCYKNEGDIRLVVHAKKI